MTVAELQNPKTAMDFDLSYIRVENIEGERVCYLYDCCGEPLIGSRSGMVPLFQYADEHGFTVCTLQ